MRVLWSARGRFKDGVRPESGRHRYNHGPLGIPTQLAVSKIRKNISTIADGKWRN